MDVFGKGVLLGGSGGGESAVIPCMVLGPGWRRQEAGIRGPQSKTNINVSKRASGV